MTELQGNLRIRFGVDEVDDTAPGVALRIVPQTRTAGVMRASGDTQVISANTIAAPPIARAPRWTRWKSPGMPSRAKYCAIGETTIRFLSTGHAR